MDWDLISFVLIAFGVGVTITGSAWAAHAQAATRRKRARPRIYFRPGELDEFRAWKRVQERRKNWGGESLYRDVNYQWTLLERERDDARDEAKKLALRLRRLEERFARAAARECETPLIRVVPRSHSARIIKEC